MKIITILIALVIGFGGGYFYNQDGNTNEAMVHDDGGNHAHTHDQVEAPSPKPVVSLEVLEDPKGGWNAKISLTNFKFAPENVSTEDVAGEGHAHIYVDGVKINRVYSEWYHLGELTPGDHEVSVRISTNDHKELLSGGELITDVVKVTVPEKEDGEAMMEEDDSHSQGGMEMEESESVMEGN